MDQLEQRVNEFFINAKKNKPEWREEQMEAIKKASAVGFIFLLLFIFNIAIANFKSRKSI